MLWNAYLSYLWISYQNLNIFRCHYCLKEEAGREVILVSSFWLVFFILLLFIEFSYICERLENFNHLHILFFCCLIFSYNHDLNSFFLEGVSETTSLSHNDKDKVYVYHTLLGPYLLGLHWICCYPRLLLSLFVIWIQR